MEAHAPLSLEIDQSFFFTVTWKTDISLPYMQILCIPQNSAQMTTPLSKESRDVISFSFNSSWDFLILSQYNQPSLCLLYPSYGVDISLRDPLLLISALKVKVTKYPGLPSYFMPVALV